MKFKLDNYFLAFCGSMDCGKPCDLVSRELADRFVKEGMLTDSPYQEYGLDFDEAIGPVTYHEICAVLMDYFDVPEIPDEAYDSLMSSTIMGDGDCPVCGGKLYLDHEDGYTKYDRRNEYPPEYVKEREVWRCEVCEYERTITF